MASQGYYNNNPQYPQQAYGGGGGYPQQGYPPQQGGYPPQGGYGAPVCPFFFPRDSLLKTGSGVLQQNGMGTRLLTERGFHRRRTDAVPAGSAAAGEAEEWRHGRQGLPRRDVSFPPCRARVNLREANETSADGIPRLAALCCCCVAEEGCECCADCCECAEDCC